MYRSVVVCGSYYTAVLSCLFASLRPSRSLTTKPFICPSQPPSVSLWPQLVSPVEAGRGRGRVRRPLCCGEGNISSPIYLFSLTGFDALSVPSQLAIALHTVPPLCALTVVHGCFNSSPFPHLLLWRHMTLSLNSFHLLVYLLVYWYVCTFILGIVYLSSVTGSTSALNLFRVRNPGKILN